MYKILINNFKYLFRQTNWTSEVIGKIIIVFIFVYTAIISFYLSKSLEELFPKQIPVDVVNQYAVYYFATIFFIRLFFQKVPFQAIEYYLHLPIKKSNIIHFLIVRSLLNYYTILSFCLFIPFGLVSVVKNYSLIQAIFWIIFMLSISMLNNYVVLYIKNQFQKNIYIFAFIIIIIIILIILNKSGLIFICKYSQMIFSMPFYYPVYIFIPFFLLILFYRLNFNLLFSLIYFDYFFKPKLHKSSRNISHRLQQNGQIGLLIDLNLKQIFRTKRLKLTLLYSFVMAFVIGFILFPDLNLSNNENEIVVLAMSYVLWSGFLINYCIMFFSWDSYQIDFFNTSKTTFKNYLISKLITIYILNFAIHFCSIIFIFFVTEIFEILLSSFFISTGFISFIAIIFSILSVKKIDPYKNIIFNNQGLSIYHFILGVVLMLITFSIYFLFDENFTITYIGLGCIGVISLFLFNNWLLLIQKMYKQQKYIILNKLR